MTTPTWLKEENYCKKFNPNALPTKKEYEALKLKFGADATLNTIQLTAVKSGHLETNNSFEKYRYQY